jgi:NTP pyrophosphatase (non-canonical NTP hydrolase)
MCDVMPTIKEVQALVHGLEESKNFGHELHQKILWMTEELGELVHAYKHNDKEKLAEEAVDVLFFVASILSILDADGDEAFMKKLERNRAREPVVRRGEFHFDKD